MFASPFLVIRSFTMVFSHSLTRFQGLGFFFILARSLDLVNSVTVASSFHLVFLKSLARLHISVHFYTIDTLAYIGSFTFRWLAYEKRFTDK